MHDLSAPEPTRPRDLFRFGVRFAPWPILGVLGLLAYRDLVSYSTEREVREETDALFFSPTDESPVLIFALALWLLYRRRQRLLAAAADPSSVAFAIPFLVLAAALCAWAHYVKAPELLVPSLSLMLLGGAGLCCGIGGMRAVLVPALFLLLAYRPPGILVNQLMYPLQLETTQGTAWLLHLLGIASESSGDQIFTEGRVFHVIESCAGLRSMETLLMASVVYAELLGRRGIHALLLAGSAPVVGGLVNQVRVLSIVLNPYSVFASVHTGQGLAMVVVGVILLSIVDWLLARFRPLRSTPPAGEDGRSPAPHASLGWVNLAALFAVLAVANWVIPPWTPPRGQEPLLSGLPPRLEGWQAEGLKLDRDFLGSVGFSEWVHRRYVKGESQVELFLASDDRLDPRVSPVSAKTALPGPSWEVLQRAPVRLDPDGLVAESSVLGSLRRQALVYHWYDGVAPLRAEALRALLALDRSPLRRPGRAVVFRASTPLPPGAEAETRESLGQFLALVRNAVASPATPSP